MQIIYLKIGSYHILFLKIGFDFEMSMVHNSQCTLILGCQTVCVFILQGKNLISCLSHFYGHYFGQSPSLGPTISILFPFIPSRMKYYYFSLPFGLLDLLYHFASVVAILLFLYMLAVCVAVPSHLLDLLS